EAFFQELNAGLHLAPMGSAAYQQSQFSSWDKLHNSQGRGVFSWIKSFFTSKGSGPDSSTVGGVHQPNRYGGYSMYTLPFNLVFGGLRRHDASNTGNSWLITRAVRGCLRFP
ncbi:unnamed protein product, partial [Amoebophrya sp. A25]